MRILDTLRRRALSTADQAVRGLLDYEATRSAEAGLRRLVRVYGADEGLLVAWHLLRERMDRHECQADSSERPTLAERQKKTNS